MEDKNTKKTAVFDLKGLLKNPKAVKWVVYGGLALLMLFFLSEVFGGSGGGNSAGKLSEINEAAKVEEYEKRIENELERAVSAVKGVGRREGITIMVTLDSLSETVYSEKGSTVKTVITPKVRGVAIICEGGGDIVVKQKIIELVSRVLGINSTKISVTD